MKTIATVTMIGMPPHFETGGRRKYHYDGYGKEGAAAATHCRIDSRRRSILRSLTLGHAEHLHFLYGFAIQLRGLPGPLLRWLRTPRGSFPFAFSPSSAATDQISCDAWQSFSMEASVRLPCDVPQKWSGLEPWQ